MKYAHPRSIIIIFIYLISLGAIVLFSLQMNPIDLSEKKRERQLAPEYTEIIDLDYFHLKNAEPLTSLSSQKMTSLEDKEVHFLHPKGTRRLNHKLLKFISQQAKYLKEKSVISLWGEVLFETDDSSYRAEKMRYFFDKDLLLARENIYFHHVDDKTKDDLVIESQSMTAHPKKNYSKFQTSVKGVLSRRKKFEGKMDFSSEELEFLGPEHRISLKKLVHLKRPDQNLTSENADIYLENFNKSLKYFVLNDDVKLTENFASPEGVIQRKAFSEKLEGFTQEGRVVLSGAPRVEQGKDMIRGYRIILREKMEFIEVEDAISEVQVKQKGAKKP